MTDPNETRECPMCGDRMRPYQRKITDLVPGTSEAKRRTVIEWICPECDYFEEDEESIKG
jgi:rubrerythrin